jgi:hypothetical protein
MRKAWAAFVLVLFFSALAGSLFVNLAAANPDTPTLIAMPEEQINYTITTVNGTLWAKIDGTYPLQILTEKDGAPSCLPPELSMVYPTPPGTNNIHLKVDETELEWSNYPQITHHTAIGDWNMIYCLITPVPEQFVLKIHYEHPLEQVNGSYIFLYDLNISPYLSPWGPNSTAYFTIRLDAKVSNLQAVTTETDEVWNPINYTIIQENTTQVMSLQMYSDYSEPLLGDLAILFSDAESQECASFFLVGGTILISALAISFGSVVYFAKFKKRKRSEA